MKEKFSFSLLRIVLAAVLLLPGNTIRLAAHGGETEVKKEADAFVPKSDSKADLVNFAKFVHPKDKITAAQFSLFLERMPQGQRSNLNHLLKLGDSSTRTVAEDSLQIRKQIVWDASHWGTYLFKSNDLDYHALVQWTAKEYGVPKSELETFSTFQLERRIFEKVFAQAWDKLEEKQRLELLDKIDTEKKIPNRAGIAAMGGSAALATLSVTVYFAGFAFYATMSTAIAAIAGFFGLTLPFAVYAGTSTTIAVLTGPIGWVIGGCLLAVGATLFGRGNHQKTALTIVQIHCSKIDAMQAAGMAFPDIPPPTM